MLCSLNTQQEDLQHGTRNEIGRSFPSLLRSDRWWPSEAGMTVQLPAVDVYKEKDDVVTKAEIPGLSKEGIGIQAADSMLTVKGKRNEKKRSKRTPTIVANGRVARVHGQWIYP
jgi:HSP20 family protein